MTMIRALTICCVSLLVTVLGQDCPYKECSCVDVNIYCGARGFSVMPQLVSQSYLLYGNIVFDGNQITTIPAGSFPSGVSRISLWDNPITAIDDKAFDSVATTLQSLMFATAQFSRIPNALMHLKALQSLEIYDSIVVDWNVDVMKSLGLSLQVFVLGNVSLATWPTWIHYLTHVNELRLMNCFLTAIPDNALDTMASSLTSLMLTGNSLTVVPKALSKLTALEELYVDQNKITDLTWLPQANKLNSLSLNNNNIFNASQLSQVLRPYAASLSDIDIKNNHLTVIPDLHFLTFQNLDLSYNMISDPFSGSLPPGLIGLHLDYNFLPSIPAAISNLTSLTQLLLSSNTIKVIQGTTIPTNVTFLDLGYNFITELTDTSFPPNSNLQKLYLNNNPLMSVSTLAFQNVQNLLELNLRNTRLTRLPLALSSLKKLNMLDITGIQGLVCTCMEKSLGPWVLSLPFDIVWGGCGQMNIHDFFSILSPNCPD